MAHMLRQLKRFEPTEYFAHDGHDTDSYRPFRKYHKFFLPDHGNADIL